MSQITLDPEGIIQKALEYAKNLASNTNLNTVIRQKALNMRVAIQDLDLSLLESEIMEKHK